jgi:hypothetical protein
MPEEKVGAKAGMSIKKEEKDKKGKTVKTTYFFPDLGVSVEAEDKDEARKLAEKKAKK